MTLEIIDECRCWPPPSDITPSCPIQIASVIPGLTWDSGYGGTANDPSPVSYNPTITLDRKGIVMALFWCVNHTEPVGGVGGYGGPGIQGVSGDFIEWFDSRQNYPTDYPSLGLSGYQSVPAGGSAGNFTVSWSPSTGSGAHRKRAIAFAFYTRETSPVQIAPYQDGAGSTVTFPNDLTPGNIIVLAKVSETGDFSPPNPPTGFSIVPPGDVSFPGLGTHHMEFCVMCVPEGGMSRTVGVGDVAWSHWAGASEWKIS